MASSSLLIYLLAVWLCRWLLWQVTLTLPVQCGNHQKKQRTILAFLFWLVSDSHSGFFLSICLLNCEVNLSRWGAGGGTWLWFKTFGISCQSILRFFCNHVFHCSLSDWLKQKKAKTMWEWSLYSYRCRIACMVLKMLPLSRDLLKRLLNKTSSSIHPFHQSIHPSIHADDPGPLSVYSSLHL